MASSGVGLLGKPIGYWNVLHALDQDEDIAFRILDTLKLKGYEWQQWNEFAVFYPSDDVSKFYIEYLEGLNCK